MDKIAPTKDILILSAALYSVSQDCYHIETLQDYLNNNIIVSLSDAKCSDYRLIGLFKSDIEAGEYIETFKNVKNKAQNK